MDFSRDQRVSKPGQNGLRRMAPPGGHSSWSPYTQFENTPGVEQRPTTFSQQQHAPHGFAADHAGSYHAQSQQRVNQAGGQYDDYGNVVAPSQTAPLSEHYDFHGGGGGGPGGNVPMNHKNEYAGAMEKRAGSGQSAGGGSSQFNPFSHAGQGHYENPYTKKSAAVSRTVVGAQSDLSFLPGQRRGGESNGPLNGMSATSARDNGVGSRGGGGWRQNAQNSRESNIFSHAASANVSARRPTPSWQPASSRGGASRAEASAPSGGGYPYPPHSPTHKHSHASAVDRAYAAFNHDPQAVANSYGEPAALSQPPPRRERKPPQVSVSSSAGARARQQPPRGGGHAPHSWQEQPQQQQQMRPQQQQPSGYTPSWQQQPQAPPLQQQYRQVPAQQTGGGGAMNRRDEVWEQKRQQRLQRRQQQQPPPMGGQYY